MTDRITCTRCGREGHRASNCQLPIPAMPNPTKTDQPAKRTHPGNATPAEIQAVTTRYAVIGPKRLAAELGVQAARLKNIAAELGIRCPHRPPALTPEMRRIHAAASAPGGASFADLADAEPNTLRYRLVVSQVERMARASSALLVYRRAGMVDGQVAVRVFANEADADAFSPHRGARELQAAYREEFARRQVERSRLAGVARRMREARAKTRKTRGDRPVAPADAADAPVRIAEPKYSISKVQTIDYSQARRISVPAPLGRYEIDPNTRVVGGFATAGIGRYLDTEAA